MSNMQCRYCNTDIAIFVELLWYCSVNITTSAVHFPDMLYCSCDIALHNISIEPCVVTTVPSGSLGTVKSYLVFSIFQFLYFVFHVLFLINSSPALDHSPAFVSQNWLYTKNEINELWWWWHYDDNNVGWLFWALEVFGHRSDYSELLDKGRKPDRQTDKPTAIQGAMIAVCACACAVRCRRCMNCKRGAKRERERDGVVEQTRATPLLSAYQQSHWGDDPQDRSVHLRLNIAILDQRSSWK